MKKIILLTISIIEALGLFLAPSNSSYILNIIVFISITTAAILNIINTKFKEPEKIKRNILIIIIEYIKFYNLNYLYTSTNKIILLVKSLSTTTSIFYKFILMLCYIIGHYITNYLLLMLVPILIKTIDKIYSSRHKVFNNIKNNKYYPLITNNQILDNLKNNWYFPISSVCFFILNTNTTQEYNYGLIISFLISILISTQISSIYKISKKNNTTIKILSILTALGITIENKIKYTYINWGIFPNIKTAHLITTICAIIAIPFIYHFILFIWSNIEKIFKENKIFHKIKSIEYIIYIMLLTTTIGYMIFTFTKSEIFYRADYSSFDTIYTSDSSLILKDNAFLSLTHEQNDLRQPLFAIFSAPFMGIPYLISNIFNLSNISTAILINIIQIIMLFLTNFLLAKILNLNSTKRICFMILSSCTYTQLLFSLMIEQYIISYFWLILCIYLIVNQKRNLIALYGAGGTLLTSLVLTPFIPDKSPIKKFKSWLLETIKYGLGFIGIMLLFCRFDIFFNLTSCINTLNSFTGTNISLINKVYQYIEFIKNYFIAPNAAIQTNLFNRISWQLLPITKINYIGIIILILVIISAILNRKKKSSQLATIFIIFSIMILIILGWGTKENALILYSLYFGWSYFILLFQLIEKIEEKLKLNFIIPITTILITTLFLSINIPAILNIINFTIKYFPI